MLQKFLKVAPMDIESYDEAVQIINEFRMCPEMICVYILAGVVGTRQGPFAHMKGLDVKCAVQG